jgi:TolB-like protein/Tfp pilus assembly protein PilF
MAVAELRLLGPFALRLSGGQTVDLPGQKDRALLAILALAGGARQSRDKLAGLLWSDRGEPQARDSLKHALTRIRQSLGEALGAALVADRQSVRLDPAGLSVDAAQFERLVREGTPEALEQACALSTGDLLDGISIRDSGFEDWLLAERQKLRRMHEDALTELLAPALPSATRERAARRLLALDPLREAASRALMQIHVERGETAQAVKLFETLKDRLHAELGVKPEPETARLYEAMRQGRAAPTPSPGERDRSQMEPALPGKPSIAVLPFQNLSGDPEQEYFADGMVEEIITALSRMRWLFVIARNSSFTYRGRAVDVKQVGRELGVRYILEGSVRKAANRVRISGQLVDVSTGAHLWADRFDGTLEEVFDLQDRVATSVVGAIAPKLEQAEIERAKRKPTESLDAYDHFLRGLACVHRWTKQASDEALQHFGRAIALDPDYASAYGMAARCYSARKVSGWVKDPELETAEAARLARKVAQIGRDDAVALYTAGMALAYCVGDLDDGAAMIERSLALNPNAAWAWLFSGWAKIWQGEPELALERIERAARMSPQDPQYFNMRTATAWAHLLAGRCDDAQSWAQSALREQPDYVNALYVLAAGSALAGQVAHAREAMARLRALDPESRISRILQRYPFRRADDLARVTEGLRLAGMPE